MKNAGLNHNNTIEEIRMSEWTPLQYASHSGSHDLVELLFRSFNASLHLTLSSPLHLAFENPHNKLVIERLLLAGADANVIDHNTGESVMHVIAKADDDVRLRREIVRLLKPFVKEETLEVRDREGRRAWEIAKDVEISGLIKPKGSVRAVI